MPFPLTPEKAKASRPLPPDNWDPRAWRNYYSDLACWKATRAEVLLSGIREAKPEAKPQTKG